MERGEHGEVVSKVRDSIPGVRSVVRVRQPGDDDDDDSAGRRLYSESGGGGRRRRSGQRAVGNGPWAMGKATEKSELPMPSCKDRRVLHTTGMHYSMVGQGRQGRPPRFPKTRDVDILSSEGVRVSVSVCV